MKWTAWILACAFLMLSSRGADARPKKAAPIGPALQRSIDDAIQRGCAYLRSVQEEDGGWSWSVPTRRATRSWVPRSCDQGLTCLVLLALARGGADHEDEAIRRGLAYLTAATKDDDKPSLRTFTYGAASLLWMVSEIKPPGFQELASISLYALLRGQTQYGQWHYALPPISIEGRYAKARATPKAPFGDISNTQFAVLGLAAAERLGMYRGQEPWTAVYQGLVQRAGRDGGFGYHFHDGAAEAFRKSNFTATTIGATMLYLKLRRDGVAHKKALAHRGIKRALRYMRKNSPYDKKSKGFRFLFDYGLGPRAGFYDMLALERLGTIAQLDVLGGCDWYRQCADYLLPLQEDAGSWPAGDKWHSGSAHKNRVQMTTFAILILSRASRTIPVTTGRLTPEQFRLQHEVPEPLYGELVNACLRARAKEYDPKRRAAWRDAFAVGGQRVLEALVRVIESGPDDVLMPASEVLVSVTAAGGVPETKDRSTLARFWKTWLQERKR